MMFFIIRLTPSDWESSDIHFLNHMNKRLAPHLYNITEHERVVKIWASNQLVKNYFERICKLLKCYDE